jgi:hypothetical protein
MNDISKQILNELNSKTQSLVELLNKEIEPTDKSFTILDLLQKIEDLKSTIIQNCSNQFDLECKEIKAVPTTTFPNSNLPPITDTVQPVYGCPIDN